MMMMRKTLAFLRLAWLGGAVAFPELQAAICICICIHVCACVCTFIPICIRISFLFSFAFYLYLYLYLFVFVVVLLWQSASSHLADLPVVFFIFAALIFVMKHK